MLKSGWLLALCFGLAQITAGGADAYRHAKPARLENFDKRPGEREATQGSAPEQRAALAQLQVQTPGLKVEFDRIVGSPKLVSSPNGFLTGPDGRGGTVAAATLQAFAADDPHRAVKSFLKQHALLFGHGPEVLDTARMQRDYVTPHSGLRTVVWEQQLDGIGVFEGLLICHVTKRGELVNISSRFVPQLAAAAERGTANRAQAIAKPIISVAEAIARAAENIGTTIDPKKIIAVKGDGTDAEKRKSFRADPLKGETRAHLVWLPMNRSSMRLCWQVELTSRLRGELFRVLIDAQTGQALVRHCLTYYLSEATYRVFTSDSPSPFSPGYALPSKAQPPLVERQLVTLSALSTNASPNGWIDDGTNELRGNNVDAHLDRNDDDLADLPRVQGSPNRVFDFPVDLTRSPLTYGNASVVQLFYWNNWIHDRLYELGFTEAAGNFQKSNFNRGGADNDAVEADAQDGGGLNDSNFSASSDGIPGRMQMYIFDGPTPDRDGDFDGEVLLHEYTHGLSTRLVGAGSGITELQSEGMGEGWSDFYALSLLSEASDDLDGNYAAGAYLSYQLDRFEENYYFGIRRYPYTTDLNKNPLTFKDLDSRQADPHRGIPISPAFGESDVAEEVHSQGEIWCVTLWEARVNLIRKWGFETGNQLILELVMDGMKLSPPNPNFIEARDAILQADLVKSGGANRDALWKAFAKRGMGFSASSPRSSTTSGVVEAFDIPDDLRLTPITPLIASGPEGGPMAPASQAYLLSNAGTNPVVWTASKTAGWFDLSTTNGILAVNTPPIKFIVTLNSAVNSLPSGLYRDVITWTNHTTGRVQTRPVVLRTSQADFFTKSFSEDENDLSNQTFTFTPDGSASFYVACREEAGIFPTDPSVGTVLSLGDDDFKQVTLSDGAHVSLYGTNYSSFYVAANGNVTFTQGVAEFSESLESHFSTPRISMLFDDLDPSSGGIVSWLQLPDRVAITFENVPNFLEGNRNSFQLEMFFDGTIRLTYLTIESSGGLVGLSNGSGVPPGFVSSNFKSFGGCFPFLHLSLPLSATEGQTGLDAEIAISEPLAADLVIGLRSLDLTTVPVPATVTIPTGEVSAHFLLSIPDNTDLDGTRIVRVLATAEGFRDASAAIRVDDNDTARLSVEVPATAKEGDGLLVNQGKVSLESPSTKAVVVYLSSSDTTEVEVPKAVVIPAGETSTSFDLTIVDDTEIDDSSSAVINAHVANWVDGAAGVVVLDNETKDLRLSLKSHAGEGNGVLKDAGTIELSGISTVDLTVTLVSSDPTEVIVPQQVIVPRNRSMATFDLTIVDDAEIDGPQTATITATADGFTSATATLVVNDNETPPMPVAPHPAHLSTNNSPDTTLSWSTGEGELLVNGGFEAGDLSGWVAQNTGEGSFISNDGMIDPEGPDEPTSPFGGRFAALSQQTGPGRNTLYQEITISPGAISAILSWNDRIRNHASLFVDPDQEFRVEIRSPGDEVLATAFSTNPGDPLLNDWAGRSFDLGDFIGQTIRIAFVEEDTFGYFNVHLDNVSVALSKFGETSYDVYFGKNPSPGAAEFQGTTMTNVWQLPRLEIDSTYHWQIVARRGEARMGSPIWEFSVPGVGPVDHFGWSSIAGTQFLNQPFLVKLEAKDFFDNVATNFSGTVSLSGLIDFPETTIGEGRQAWEYPLGGFLADSRIQAIYPVGEVGPARRITALSLFVETVRQSPVNRVTIRMKHTSLQNYSGHALWERSGWTTVFQKSVTLDERGWVRLQFTTPFDYDGLSNLMIDFSHRDSGFASGGDCRYSFTTDVRSLSYQSFDFFGDPLAWSGGQSPAPDLNKQIPNIQLWAEDPVTASPTVSGNFANGVWSGEISIHEPAEGVTLKAEDDEGHFGKGNPFDVLVQDDVSVTAAALPNPITVGQDLVYTFAVRNSGPSPATGVIVSNTFPASLTFVSATLSQGSFVITNQTLLCNLGALLGGSNATVTLIVNTGTSAGLITNFVQVLRNEPDAYTPNNTASIINSVNPVPSISIGDVTVAEGDSGTTNATFTLRLSVPSSQVVSVNYQDAEGTAAKSDYVPAKGTLIFSPGVIAQEIAMQVNGDTEDELDEVFYLNLSSPTNATLARLQASATILDDDGPEIQISNVTVTERNKGVSNAVFSVTLNRRSVQPITVEYATADGSALAGSDYDTASGTLTFSPGTTNQTIAVPIRGDRRIESSERFFVNLFDPVHATVASSQGVCTIVNDDGLPGDLDHFDWEPISSPQIVNEPFAVRVLAKDVFNRPATNFTGTARLSGEIPHPEAIIGDGDVAWDEPLGTFYEDSRIQSIYLATEVGQARPITALALNFTTAPDLTLHRFTIRIKHTNLKLYGATSVFDRSGWTVVYQADETISETGWVIFQFSKPFPYNGVSNLAIDLSFNNSDYSFSGSECLSTQTDTIRSLWYASDSEDGDPLNWSGSTPEPELRDQILNIRLSAATAVAVSPTNSDNFVNGLWTGGITVQEIANRMVLVADDGEGHKGRGNLFDMTAVNDLSLVMNDSPDPVTIEQPFVYTYTIHNSGPSDSTGVILSNTLPQTVVFVSATSSQGNSVFDGGTLVCDVGTIAGGSNAIVTVQVKSPLAAGILTNTANVTRNEIDTYRLNNTAVELTTINPQPLISVADVTVQEGDIENVGAAFKLSLSVPSSQIVTVNYATADSTAEAGSDYTAASGLVTFPPGVISQFVTVQVLGDLLDEIDEQFFLNLSNPTNAALSRVQASCRIIDNDGPLVSISKLVVAEGDSGTNNAVFNVRLSAASPQTISVDYSTADDSATSGSDYIATSGTLTFRPGVTNLAISVRIKGDITIEPDETFLLELLSATNATLQVTEAEGTIRNDDGLPGELDHFEWGSIGSPKWVDQPFTVTLLAKDGLNQPAINFNGLARLTGEIKNPETEIGNGDSPWDYPIGSFYDDSRLQAIYLAKEVGGARRINGLALNVGQIPGRTLNGWTIRMKHTTRASYPPTPTWERTGWTTVYQADETIETTGWISFPFSQPFDFNGTNHLMIDFTFHNENSPYGEGACLSTDTPDVRSISFQSFSFDAGPLNWTGQLPPPDTNFRVPNIRLSSGLKVPVQPASSGNFVNGKWIGTLLVSEPATNLVLRAVDLLGHSGEGSKFNVIRLIDSDRDGLPDDWEVANGFDPNDAGDATLDFDNDGLSNAAEYFAGTNPRDPESSLRILAPRRDADDAIFHFNTVAGKMYQVERAAQVDALVWEVLEEGTPGTGEMMEVTDKAALGAGSHFYRVRILP